MCRIAGRVHDVSSTSGSSLGRSYFCTATRTVLCNPYSSLASDQIGDASPENTFYDHVLLRAKGSCKYIPCNVLLVARPRLFYLFNWSRVQRGSIFLFFYFFLMGCWHNPKFSFSGIGSCDVEAKLISMAMLEATEDGSDTRPAPAGTEESPATASKPSVDDRLVYKLVKVYNSLFDFLDFLILLPWQSMTIFINKNYAYTWGELKDAHTFSGRCSKND